MKKIGYIIVASFCSMHALLLCFTSKVVAQDTFAPVVITEMMPGTAVSGSQEFIELYNQSAAVVDLTAGNWALHITTSKATSWDKPKIVRLQGSLQPGAYLIVSSNYVAAGEGKSYLQEYANAQFSSGLTASSGHIQLVRTAGPGQESIDRLEWTTLDNGQPVSPSIDGLSTKVLEQPLDSASSLKRLIHNGIFAATTDANADFIVSVCPSPTATYEIPTEPLQVPVATTIDTINQQCAPPPSDDSEEPIPQPSEEPPATLLPAENTVVPGAVSVPKIPAGNIGLVAPQLTELLPNPKAPQTDAEDEFVELYNPNALPYDLSGYVLRIGLTGSKKYTFPAGTKLPPKTFVAFFSADTKISLSNSSGKIVLFDPLEREIGKTDQYSTAKDNQSWARAQGTWQWTTQPTPNAENAIRAPAVTTKKSTTSKAAAAKTAASATNKKSQTAAGQNSATFEEPEQKSNVHPLVLAVVGGFALLYGAYEYRHDMANKFHQLRSYRAARRENRAQSEGR
jgi:hypothetical protein